MSRAVPGWLGHSLSEANKRSIEKAKRADMTPVCFDADAGYAEFSSRNGHYCTTLDRCTGNGKPCGGGFPCKHMYRLAMELGLMPGDFKSDITRVDYQRSGVSLEDAIARAESVSLDAQRFLSIHLRSLRKGPLNSRFVSSPVIPELISANLLIRIDEPDEIRMHPDIDKSSYKLYTYLLHKFEDIDCEASLLAELEQAGLPAELPQTAPADSPPFPDVRNLPGNIAFLLGKLSTLDGISVTVNGAQSSSPVVWLSGSVDSHKSKIEQFGGKWSAKRSAWYFKPDK